MWIKGLVVALIDIWWGIKFTLHCLPLLPLTTNQILNNSMYSWKSWKWHMKSSFFISWRGKSQEAHCVLYHIPEQAEVQSHLQKLSKRSKSSAGALSLRKFTETSGGMCADHCSFSLFRASTGKGRTRRSEDAHARTHTHTYTPADLELSAGVPRRTCV